MGVRLRDAEACVEDNSINASTRHPCVAVVFSSGVISRLYPQASIVPLIKHPPKACFTTEDFV